MGQAGRSPGLILETASALAMIEQLGVQHLDGDGPSQLEVFRQQHLTHAATTQHPTQPVTVPDNPALRP